MRRLRRLSSFLSLGPIGRRLTLTFVVLVSGVALGTGLVLFRLTERTIDRQLGTRLESVALLVASGIDGDVVVRFQPGWDGFRVVENARAHLLEVREAAEAARISVFDRNGRILLDTSPGVAIGTEDVRLRLNPEEVSGVWEGDASHSLLFTDGGGDYFMAGYAPLRSGERVAAGVRVDIGAGFTAVYAAFGRSVAILAAAGSLVTLVVGVLFARSLTRSLARLVDAAREIGRGRLDRPVPAGPDDEIGTLGRTIETMRRSLVDRENELRQMLAGVAHEIGNPLGGIEIYAGLIADDLADSDPQKTHIRRVIGEVGTLKRVLSEFMDFARPAAPDPSSVDVKTLVDDVAFLIAPEIDQGGVRLTADIRDGLRAYADGEQVKRALLNLMKNAAQAMPNGGDLRVSGKVEGDRIVVEVSDTGPGISDDVMARIFEPFFTTREKGSGLGLVIVKRIADENGGRLEVETREGVGTVFRLDLPGAA